MSVLALAFGMSACGGPKVEAWQDDFSDVSSGWHAESDAAADVGYSEGVMRIHVRWPNKLSWASAGRDLADFHVSVSASQVAGPDDNEYGLLVRMRDEEHFYIFAISGDGYYRVLMRDGDSEELLTSDWAQSDAIHTGTATNLIEVICQGPAMTFVVNGEAVAEVTDGTYSHGDIALYAGTFRDPGDGVEIHFDDFAVNDTTAP
jgi:hypothetical protein